MRPAARLRSFVNSLFHRSHLESEIDAELRFHIESRAADLEHTGLEPQRALRQARLEFGHIEKYKEGIRESLGL